MSDNDEEMKESLTGEGADPRESLPLIHKPGLEKEALSNLKQSDTQEISPEKRINEDILQEQHMKPNEQDIGQRVRSGESALSPDSQFEDHTLEESKHHEKSSFARKKKQNKQGNAHPIATMETLMKQIHEEEASDPESPNANMSLLSRDRSSAQKRRESAASKFCLMKDKPKVNKVNIPTLSQSQSVESHLRAGFNSQLRRDNSTIKAQQNLLEEEQNDIDMKDQICYGSYVQVKVGKAHTGRGRVLATRYTISQEVTAKIDLGKVDENTVFRIVPPCVYHMHQKVQSIIKQSKVSDHLERDYENLKSEMGTNIEKQKDLMGKPVLYGAKFQLLHKASQRYLSCMEQSVDTVKAIFDDVNYMDQSCLYLGFDHYSGETTHFQIFDSSSKTTNNSKVIKKDHQFHLTNKQGTTQYTCHVKDNYTILTQSYKTPLQFNWIEDSSRFEVNKDVGNTSIAIITQAYSQYALSVDKNIHTGETKVVLKEYADLKQVDYESWWVFHSAKGKGVIDSQVQIQHYATGLFVNIKDGFVLKSKSVMKPSMMKVQKLNSNEELVKLQINGGMSRKNYVSAVEIELNGETRGLQVGECCHKNAEDTFKVTHPTSDQFQNYHICYDNCDFLKFIIKQIERSDDRLKKVAHFSDVLIHIICDINSFVTNTYKGMIMSDFSVGQVVPDRQSLVMKMGISKCMYEIVNLINDQIHDKTLTQWEDLIHDLYKIHSPELTSHTNLLDLLFSCLTNIIHNNSECQTEATVYVVPLSQFGFLDTAPDLLITIFRTKSFELNKFEIHQEIFYRRIYDYDYQHFSSIATIFCSRLKQDYDQKYIYVLRNMVVINQSPLPLMQKHVYDQLQFKENISDDQFKQVEFTKFEVMYDSQGKMGFLYGETYVKASMFERNLTKQQQQLCLDQMSLEADLCYGVNKYVMQGMKKKYPSSNLILNLIRDDIPDILRAVLIRLLTFLYILDDPHKIQRYSRAFKAYEPYDETIKTESCPRSKEITQYDWDTLFNFIITRIDQFHSQDFKRDDIQTSEISLIRLCKYLIKFGLFTQRNDKFQAEDLFKLFGYCCYMLDILTNTTYSKHQLALDLIISKDAINEKFNSANPVRRSFHDIKHWLLNKNDWIDDQVITIDTCANDRSQKYRIHSSYKNLILDIVEINHFILDIRQNFLVQNVVENFYNKVFTLSQSDCDDMELMTMAEELASKPQVVVPDTNTFDSTMSFHIPSLDTLYDERYYERIALEYTDPEIKKQIHDEYLTLIIDCFNLCVDDPILKNHWLCLIARYYSERAEMSRNIDRALLLLDQDEANIYQWLSIKLFEFKILTEHSGEWLNTKVDDDGNSQLVELTTLLRRVECVQSGRAKVVDNQGGELTLEMDMESDSNVRRLCQKMMRNLKYYDFIIDFFTQNQDLMVQTRQEGDEDTDNSISNIFRLCLQIMVNMAKNNSENQNLFFKYKELFVFPQLRDLPNQGELDLVLTILKNNDNANKTRSMKKFVKILSRRAGNKDNYLILLEIYNILIMLNQSCVNEIREQIVDSILQDPSLVIQGNFQSFTELRTVINYRRVLANVLNLQDLKYVKDKLCDIFPIEDYNLMIQTTIEAVDQLGWKHGLDEDDFEEFRYSAYATLAQIYINLYFDCKETNLELLAENSQQFIGKAYKDLMLKLIKADFELLKQRTKDIRQSLGDAPLTEGGERQEGKISKAQVERVQTKTDIQYVIHYVQRIISIYSEFNQPHIKDQLAEQGKSAKSLDTLNNITKEAHKMIEQLKMSIETSQNPSLQLMKQSMQEQLIGEHLHQNNESSPNEEVDEHASMINSFKTPSPITKYTMVEFRQETLKHQLLQKRKGIYKAWQIYAESLVSGDKMRAYVEAEIHEFAEYMFSQIVKKIDKDLRILFSLKKFMWQSMYYIHSCEKQTWTSYNIIFVFNIMTQLVHYSHRKMIGYKVKPWQKLMIHKRIIDVIGSQRVTSIIYGLLSQHNPPDITFTNSALFLNTLLLIAPQKFQGIFHNYLKSKSDKFFQNCSFYLKIHQNKIAQNELKSFYEQHEHIGNLSRKTFIIDKNVEKQIIMMFRGFCEDQNTAMQDILRHQPENQQSLDMISTTLEYFKVITKQLQYPILYDIATTCLSALQEFVQGPNYENQEVLVHGSFVEYANQVLEMPYNHMDEDTSPSQEEGKDMIGVQGLKDRSPGYKIQIPKYDYMISTLKLGVCRCLIYILAGKDFTNDIYYLYRRTIDPDSFKMNLAYLDFYYDSYHQKHYDSQIFTETQGQQDYSNKSPFLIELGFCMYVLLREIEASMAIEFDQQYEEIIGFLPSQSDNVKMQRKFSYFKKLFNISDEGVMPNLKDVATRDIWNSIFWPCRVKYKPKGRQIYKRELDDIMNNSRQLQSILKFYTVKTSKIEIFRNGLLKMVYFPKLPYCEFNDEKLKDTFQKGVVRTSAQTKCEGLSDESNYLLINAKARYTMRYQMGIFFKMVSSTNEVNKRVSMLMIIIQNILALNFYVLDVDKEDETHLTRNSYEILIILILGFLIVVLGILIFVDHMTWLIMTTLAKVDYERKRRKEQEVKKLISSQNLNSMKKTNPLMSGLTKCNSILYNIFTDTFTLYYICYLITGILGLASHPFWFSFHLSFMIVTSSVLYNVLLAVWEPKSQIFWTIILLLITVYVFTVFAFSYFPGDYGGLCTSLWNCFFVSMDQTFKSDGALGGYLTPPYLIRDEAKHATMFYWRLGFDFTFNLVVAILVVEIISGIIIDKFGDLRGQSEKIKEDTLSNCFICGQSRENLEKNYNDFDNHVKLIHNMWDYVYFVAYLQNKKLSIIQDFTDDERYVLHKLENDDNSWYPCYFNYDDNGEQQKERLETQIQSEILKSVRLIVKQTQGSRDEEVKVDGDEESSISEEVKE